MLFVVYLVTEAAAYLLTHVGVSIYVKKIAVISNADSQGRQTATAPVRLSLVFPFSGSNFWV